MIYDKMLHVDANNSNECRCPHCDHDEMRFDNSYFTDELSHFVYEFVCENCGAKGKQWYSLVFDGYTYSEPDND